MLHLWLVVLVHHWLLLVDLVLLLRVIALVLLHLRMRLHMVVHAVLLWHLVIVVHEEATLLELLLKLVLQKVLLLKAL